MGIPIIKFRGDPLILFLIQNGGRGEGMGSFIQKPISNKPVKINDISANAARVSANKHPMADCVSNSFEEPEIFFQNF